MFPLDISYLRPNLGDDNRLYWRYANAHILKILSYSPIAYWPMNEASGSVAKDLSGNGLDGAYTGVTLGQPGMGDGNRCPYFDGASGYLTAFSAGLAAVVDPDEISIAGWMKANSAAVWADGNSRFPFYTRANGNNWLALEKQSDAELQWTTRANTVYDTAKDDCSGFLDQWYHFVCTRSKTADEVECFIDAVQWGSTASTLGAWAGTIDDFFIGCKGHTPQNFWHGWLAHPAIFDSILPGTTITDLAAG